VTIRPSPQAPQRSLLELTHLGSNGARSAVAFVDNTLDILTAEADTPDCSSCDYGAPGWELMGSYDFDHDGVPEAWIRHTGFMTLHTDAIFTLRGGKIVRYAPADILPEKGFELRDVDHDGIPDLAFRHSVGGEEAGCGAPSEIFFTDPLVAHAKPDGTFSLDDDAAQAAARQVCPAPPADLSKTKTVHDVFCARVWGVPPSGLVHFQQDRDRCFRRYANATGPGCVPKGRRACPREAQLADFIQWAPPFVLH
jgi:hypothetical protein